MQSGNEADVKVARTTTRMYDFVNRGAEFTTCMSTAPGTDARGAR
ncbi:hypothetical protein [Edaphobacter aggregans]|nr:hypothetical protein [Edaphobacter aggregans]